jgi:hypothetical protein
MQNHIGKVITARRLWSCLAHGIGVVTVGAVLALCCVNAQAQDNGTTHTTLTLAGAFDDLCTGEFVLGTLTIDAAFHIVTDISGSVHVSEHFAFSFQGVGETSGAVYTGKEVDDKTGNFKFGPDNETEVLRFTLTGDGSTQVVTIHSHITFNANGTVTSTIDDVELTCQ